MRTVEYLFRVIQVLLVAIKSVHLYTSRLTCQTKVSLKCGILSFDNIRLINLTLCHCMKPSSQANYHFEYHYNSI